MSVELKICRAAPSGEQQTAEDIYPLCGFSCTFERDFGRDGQIVSNGLRGGEIVVQSDLPPAERLVRWMFDRVVRSNGSVINRSKGAEKAEITFSDARPVSYNLHYDARAGVRSLIGTLRIEAGKITTADDAAYEKQ